MFLRTALDSITEIMSDACSFVNILLANQLGEV